MDETAIIFFGLLISEPVTSITDLFVSAVCFNAFISLKKKNEPLLHFKLINWFFFTMGLATLFGGLIGHAFIYAFSFGWKLPGWLMSMLSISLLERASIEYAKPLLPKKLRKFMDWANIIELVTFMSLTFSFLDFRFVEIHSAFGLLAVNTPLYIFIYFKTKNKTSKFMITAISFAMLSALVFMNKISIHKWFNHLDLSHILMAIAAYFFFQGAKFFKNRLI
jgi:Family of unknown function (DUF6962)